MSIPLTINTSQIDKTRYSASDFTIFLSPPIRLGSLNYSVKCTKLTAWYSSFNISSALKNNKFYYSADNGMTWETATIEDGNYTIPDLDTYIKREIMYPNGDFGPNPDTGKSGINDDPEYFIHLEPRYAQNRVRINITDADYRVSFTQPDNLATFLGFYEVEVTSTTTGTKVPEVSNGIDSWVLHCSLVGKGYSNGNSDDILLTFTPNVPPQANFTIEPINPPACQISEQVISQIRFKLTDQTGLQVIDLQGEDIVIQLLLDKIVG